MVRNANRRRRDAAARQVTCSRQNNTTDNSQGLPTIQVPLIGELSDDNCCRIGEVVSTGRTPVLTALRELLSQGVNPDAAAEIYRNGVLALRVRSIQAGAALTVSEETDRPPRFKRWKPLDLGDGSPPARQIQNSDLLPTEAAE
jgi:hypothetical protein